VPALAAPTSGGLWQLVANVFDGAIRAFQRDIHVNPDIVFAQTTFFTCATQIASDISKVGVDLVQRLPSTRRGLRPIEVPVDVPAFSPLLRKPNDYQTWQQFVEHWVLSKVTTGKAIHLIERDDRNVPVALHTLNSRLVQPMVTPSGRVLYRLVPDALAGIGDVDPDELIAVPASEIIHDRYNTLFHPLCGLSPIYACGIAAMQSHHIATQSARFFENQARPGGFLLAPDKINEETAARLRDAWQRNYTGENAGKVAVLGDGLRYEKVSVDPVDAQLVEQLQLSAKQIAGTMHVPGFLAGVSDLPSLSNIQALLTVYYSLCLQPFAEAIENCMDIGLGLGPVGRTPETRSYGVRLNLRQLLRMDNKTMAETHGILVQRGIEAIDEARSEFDLPPVSGGAIPFLQQQNWSVEALAAREQDQSPPAGGAAGPAGDGGAGAAGGAGDGSGDGTGDGTGDGSGAGGGAGGDGSQQDVQRALRLLSGVELARQAAAAQQEARAAIDRARRAEDALAHEQRAASVAALGAAIADQLLADDADGDGA
jgi:HK97 family phage portal protein